MKIKKTEEKRKCYSTHKTDNALMMVSKSFKYTYSKTSTHNAEIFAGDT